MYKLSKTFKALSPAATSSHPVDFSASLDEVINHVNYWVESIDQYVQSDECPHAEYVQSFGYGDADTTEVLDNVERLLKDSIDRELVDEITTYLGSLSSRDLFHLLSDHARLEHTPNIYSIHGEIFGISLGEIEEELPDDLKEELKSLSPEDLQTLYSSVDVPLKGACGYLDYNYHRWTLILDTDSLVEAYNNKAI